MFNKKNKVNQTTFCYCPNCKNELISSGSFVSDEDLVTYRCTLCNQVSEWYFDCPVPILISPKSDWNVFLSEDYIKRTEDNYGVKFTYWQRIYLKLLSKFAQVKNRK